MKIKKLKPSELKPGTHYSILGKWVDGKNADLLNAEFMGIGSENIYLLFKNTEGKTVRVKVHPQETLTGFNVVEHDQYENEWFILGDCDFLIHGFESESEAKEYFATNKEKLVQFNYGNAETVEVRSGSELGDIALEIFYVNQSALDVKWIEKTQDLSTVVFKNEIQP